MGIFRNLGVHKLQKGAMGPKCETYTRYSEVDEKEQKNVSGLIKGSFEIYTR